MMPGVINNSRPGFSSASEARGRGGLPKQRFYEEGMTLPLALPAAVRGSCKTTPQNIKGMQSRLNMVQVEMQNNGSMRENVELAVDGAAQLDYGTSGSDHYPNSLCLFAMDTEFAENEGVVCKQSRLIASKSSSSKRSLDGNGSAEMVQTLQSLGVCTDSAEEQLLSNVQLIMASLVQTRPQCDGCKATSVTGHGCLKRTVMTHLQKSGYNAAVCKTKWDHSCGVPAGDYEYVDVLLDGGVKHPERIIVDIDFQAQFEIARPTTEFSEIWQLLPAVFVGRPERLKQIVYLMSETTKQSLRVKGLHLPPWRKPAYMKAKWFSSYKRTSNNSPTRPCRDGVHYNHGLGFAVRGGALDARYTNELENLYHDARANFLLNGGKDMALLRRGRDEITVMATDWQPPAVAPKPLQPTSRVTGLTSLMKQVQASRCNEMLIQAV